MKKILLIITFLLLVTSLFSSCDLILSEEQTNQTKQSTINETNNSSTEDISQNLFLINNKVSEYVIVRPEKSSDELISACSDFFSDFKAKTGVTGLSIKVDWYKSVEEISDYEIIIGDTNREETDWQKSQLTDIEGNTFTISVLNNKVIIYGTNDRSTILAMKYFLDNYIVDNGDNFNTLTIPKDTSYTGPITPKLISAIIDSGDSFTTTVTKIMDIPKDGDFKVLQGGCTDGEYVYSMLENQTVSPGQSKILKIDLKTKTIIAKSDILNTDHSNDMTYNSKTNELIIVHNAPNYNLISIIDASTLKYKKTVALTVSIYAISYDEYNDRYIVGISGTYNFAYLDKDFKVIETKTGKDTGNIKQGVDSDDKYIYFVMYKTNTINVYNKDGDYISEIPLSDISVEPENIFHIGDKLYVACYVSGNGGRIYNVNIIPQK